ncbi:MAG: hypothetical protein IIB57_08085 [Planctomycetes bacterium]|nr:hypothetical protein [Planctomycetota bacterium]
MVPQILLALAVAQGGCVAGSLASNTGPRPPELAWSMAGKQMVHVGEVVEFDFVLRDWTYRFVHPLGIADYCVAFIGEERLETTPDHNGHFQFAYKFDRIQAGDKINVKATAYRTKGARDFMKVRGTWLRSDSAYDKADQRVASDKIRLVAYQVPVELTMVRPADDLDTGRGVLKIHRTHGPTTTVFVDKPGQPGFAIDGPEPDGYYRIGYQPSGSELNSTGTTRVDFTIYDTMGLPHRASLTLQTP